MENGAINFTITGASTREGNHWGSGPYPVELNGTDPAALFQPVSSTAALRMQIVAVAPPEPAVGARPLLDPANAAFTSLTATAGAGTHEVDFTTTPAATGNTWWDFGDGEWDYVVAPGATTHTYAAAGTYTVRASQNGVNWTTVTATAT